MNVLVIGSGGREHALAWALAKSDEVNTVFVAPGNAGTAKEPKLENVYLDITDFAALADFADKQAVALTVVGPEAPLVDGFVDYFDERQLPCFGPSQAASELEGSKSFTKDFLARHNIPTASYATFTEPDHAIAYLATQQYPIVIKADGLAAGKGVIIAEDEQTAQETVRDMLSGNAFGDAGCKVVIEEFLQGEEASFIVVADDTDFLAMATSQDHKRAGDNDTGPNTGGMGAYSPAPVVTDDVHQRIVNEVIQPTLNGMKQEGKPYRGFLYAGLMIAPDGTPKVIEFNCRFGDPETQPIMMRLKTPLHRLCLSALNGTLTKQSIEWDARPAVGVVMAAKGYPASYPKGHTITGLDQTSEDTKVFHAGTSLQGDDCVTSGGRVLCVTALGDTITDAQRKAYKRLDSIRWEGCQYRRDIAYRAIEREQV